MNKILLLPIALALSALSLVGCGGGGVGGGGGGTIASNSLKVNVAWPTSKSRVIPAAANGIVIYGYKDEVQVARAIIARPGGLFSPNGFAGDYTVTATSAYDGSKSASTVIHVASGSGSVTIN
jgi:hypothetical protein